MRRSEVMEAAPGDTSLLVANVRFAPEAAIRPSKVPLPKRALLREPVAPGLAQADLLDRARVRPLREQAGDLPRVAKCRDSSA
jgi:hypothetical protein